MEFKKENERMRKLAGVLANNEQVDNVATIDKFNSVNGSGSQSFGGAKKWPSLTLRVCFQADEKEQRDKLAEKLEQVVLEFMQELRV